MRVRRIARFAIAVRSRLAGRRARALWRRVARDALLPVRLYLDGPRTFSLYPDLIEKWPEAFAPGHCRFWWPVQDLNL